MPPISYRIMIIPTSFFNPSLSCFVIFHCLACVVLSDSHDRYLCQFCQCRIYDEKDRYLVANCAGVQLGALLNEFAEFPKNGDTIRIFQSGQKTGHEVTTSQQDCYGDQAECSTRNNLDTYSIKEWINSKMHSPKSARSLVKTSLQTIIPFVLTYDEDEIPIMLEDDQTYCVKALIVSEPIVEKSEMAMIVQSSPKMFPKAGKGIQRFAGIDFVSVERPTPYIIHDLRLLPDLTALVFLDAQNVPALSLLPNLSFLSVTCPSDDHNRNFESKGLTYLPSLKTLVVVGFNLDLSLLSPQSQFAREVGSHSNIEISWSDARHNDFFFTSESLSPPVPLIRSRSTVTESAPTSQPSSSRVRVISPVSPSSASVWLWMIENCEFCFDSPQVVLASKCGRQFKMFIRRILSRLPSQESKRVSVKDMRHSPAFLALYSNIRQLLETVFGNPRRKPFCRSTSHGVSDQSRFIQKPRVGLRPLSIPRVSVDEDLPGESSPSTPRAGTPRFGTASSSGATSSLSLETEPELIEKTVTISYVRTRRGLLVVIGAAMLSFVVLVFVLRVVNGRRKASLARFWRKRTDLVKKLDQIARANRSRRGLSPVPPTESVGVVLSSSL
uniref:Uncharacterized protein n=1 Tax=Spongospora subterranea TaxID=70186 RepID=A0A0H5R5J7_9EUKA|eukprot:CRZ09408.1 hypothetical protein [Spongospora subterranea]